MSQGYKRLSDAEVDRIHQLWRQYRSYRKVAEIMGVHRDTANKYRPRDVPKYPKRKFKEDRTEQQRRAQAMFAEGYDYATIARQLGINWQTAKSWCGVRKQKGFSTWSLAMQQRWLEFWARPESVIMLADFLGGYDIHTQKEQSP